jgi:hypothetical protein
VSLPRADDKPPHFVELYKGLAALARDSFASLVGASEMEAFEADAAREFEALIDDIPYAERPGHAMALPALASGVLLAFYKAARARGYSAHEFGRALHEAPFPDLPESRDAHRHDAAESQQSAAPNEFVWEFLDGEGQELDYGYNIKSCAICHLYGRHDAMELVPYMCAIDDKMSAAQGTGLRRTGTIALGADRCDFRFRKGGDPLTLESQYRDRVRLRDTK